MKYFGIKFPSSEDVNKERLRRLETGVTVNITGYGDIKIQGRQQDMLNLTGLKDISQIRIAQGDTTTLTTFRDADNIDHDLTPAELIDLWSKGVTFISDIYAKSWVLKDTDPIPENYESEIHWA